MFEKNLLDTDHGFLTKYLFVIDFMHLSVF